ncbi:MAG: Cna B-type domain-containing protein [Oscillospiraceae bacterium]|nr:Cna B-type domain-containing protein [Oscillospiraceae bacterium]
MKRLIKSILAALLVLTLASGAAYALDSQPSSLTVAMKSGETPLGGIGVAVCLVAGALEGNGWADYVATPAFADAQADFTDLTKEKNIALAATLDAYATAHDIQRSQKTTGADGKAAFPDLSAGLYLVAQTDGESSEYIIAPYLVAVPVMNERTRSWDYNVTAYPKTEPIRRDIKVDSVSVYKVWAGTDTPPGGILAQLYRDGVPYGNCVTLDDSNQWTHTWDNLDPDSTWTVDEFDVAEGYAKKISGSASTEFIITNTKTPNAPSKVPISGSKTWEHGSNPPGQQPKSIVLRFYANGVFILQKEIGEADHWSWSVRMDKYDKDGKEIVYTIDEAPVSDYIKAVDGYNLINIHKSYSGKPTQPPTGDLSNLALWLCVMGASFMGLATVIVIFAGMRKRRKTKSS